MKIKGLCASHPPPSPSPCRQPQPQPARFAGSVSSPGLIITESLADSRNKYLASQRLMPRSQTPANTPALPPVSCPLECVRKTRKVCSLWKLDRRQQLIFPSSA
ncbi:unnamed protein product [Eretmochelys imbricata]